MRYAVFGKYAYQPQTKSIQRLIQTKSIQRMKCEHLAKHCLQSQFILSLKFVCSTTSFDCLHGRF